MPIQAFRPERFRTYGMLMISIFNEYGWHWTYHAFREWAGWSVEHEADGFMKFRPAADTPRKRALLEGLVK